MSKSFTCCAFLSNKASPNADIWTTGSSPNINLVKSKSWIVVSLKNPPAAFKYSIPGGSGSLLVMTTISNSPISFFTLACCAFAWLASNLLLNPIWIGTFIPLIFSIHSFTLLISKSIGFSQKIAFPAFAAIVINWVWVGVADAIRTASISSELIASSGEDAIEHSVDFATSSANWELTS